MKRYTLLLLSLLTIVTSLASDIPEQSVVLPHIDRESFERRLLATDMQPLEGVWYYPNEEMTLGVERWHGQHNIEFRLILLESTDLELMPGTVMGFIARSAKPDKLQLWLYSQRRGALLRDPLECVATLNEYGDVLTFDPPKWNIKLRANFGRFLPSLFRGISITPEYKKEQLPVGFRKVFPIDTSRRKGQRVRYL